MIQKAIRKKKIRYGWLALGLLLLAAGLSCFALVHHNRQQAQQILQDVEVLSLSQQPLTSTQAAQQVQSALEQAETYRSYMEEIKVDDTVNFTISDDDIRQIIDLFARQGNTVVDGQNAINMENAQEAQTFGQKVQKGEAGSVCIFRIYDDGGFSRSDFTTDGETSWVTTVRIAWDHTRTPRAVSCSKRDLLQLTYTDKGYLIYAPRELDSVKNGPSYVPYQMIRVLPLDQECRQLCSKYIRPVGYGNNNLFLTTWSAEDCSDLILNDAFPACYFLDTGTVLSSHDCADFTFESQKGLLIPAEIYVQTLGRYLDLPSDKLLRQSYLDTETGCYPTRIFSSNDLSTCNAVPEVVSSQTNSDGSLTLYVEALDPYQGTDCAFAHEVCVRSCPDGSWKYVSNKISPEQAQNLPPYENYYQ